MLAQNNRYDPNAFRGSCAARAGGLRQRRPLAGATLALGLLALVPALAGCQGTIAGRWHMVEVVPNKLVFNIDDASFNRDGTFSATTTLEGKTAREVGTYDFNGFKLILCPQAGGRRAYNAVLKFNRLEVLDGKRKVVLARGT